MSKTWGDVIFNSSNSNSKAKINQYKFPLLVILAGVLFSLFLQSQLPNDVFFSGDAGLKALLAKQFSSGQFRFDLNLPVEEWVRNLWQSGLYPFQRHFPSYPVFAIATRNSSRDVQPICCPSSPSTPT